MVTCKPWQVQPGSCLLLQQVTIELHLIFFRYGEHVNIASKTTDSTSVWRESAEGYTRVLPVSSAWGKVPKSPVRSAMLSLSIKYSHVSKKNSIVSLSLTCWRLRVVLVFFALMLVNAAELYRNSTEMTKKKKNYSFFLHNSKTTYLLL